jgi:hypothetical protein
VELSLDVTVSMFGVENEEDIKTMNETNQNSTLDNNKYRKIKVRFFLNGKS